MQILEVNDKKREEDFILVNVRMYRKDPLYVRPLDGDIQKIFDPSFNPFFRQGACKRWVLKNGGELIGRIAAFYYSGYKNKGDDVIVGCIGFFECIDDQHAANLLFDTAKHWLESLGVEAMDGPVNFGDRNMWWGLLVEGFKPPLYGMNYNPPYYRQLFEGYGFQVFYYQLCWQLQVDTALPDKLYATHQKHAVNSDIRVEKIDKSQLDKYAADFAEVYNRAWAQHEGNKKLTTVKAIRLFNSLKTVMDEDLMWFTYHGDQPIAVWLNIPDLNQLTGDFRGRLNWWQKMKLLYRLRSGKCKRFVGIVYGVVPEWQGTGVDYYMIVEASRVIQRKNYKELELQWQGDFNPKMIAISRQLGCTLSRKLATFRYLFDETKEFHRHPVLEYRKTYEERKIEVPEGR
jgi:hypothetical protein